MSRRSARPPEWPPQPPRPCPPPAQVIPLQPRWPSSHQKSNPTTANNKRTWKKVANRHKRNQRARQPHTQKEVMRMADNNGDFGAFLTGFIIGGLVGAVASLLMAPQSGEETREQIRQRGIELRSRADEEIKRIREQAEQTLAEVRAQTEEIQKRTQELVEEAR
ncbi:MAG TPA: YtxH domain-containing protein, partial [Chloroflexi bacterium]|nr:YtxH domain-containing protein [Chloroflexota bacterium]